VSVPWWVPFASVHEAVVYVFAVMTGFFFGLAVRRGR
jgi:hypothetical protein